MFLFAVSIISFYYLDGWGVDGWISSAWSEPSYRGGGVFYVWCVWGGRGGVLEGLWRGAEAAGGGLFIIFVCSEQFGWGRAGGGPRGWGRRALGGPGLSFFFFLIAYRV